MSNAYVSVTSGLRGYFATLIVDDEPWQSGIGSYETVDGAAEEAASWAQAERVPFKLEGYNSFGKRTPGSLRAAIDKRLPCAPPKLRATVRAWLATVPDNVEALSAGLKRLSVIMAEERQLLERQRLASMEERLSVEERLGGSHPSATEEKQ